MLIGACADADERTMNYLVEIVDFDVKDYDLNIQIVYSSKYNKKQIISHRKLNKKLKIPKPKSKHRWKLLQWEPQVPHLLP